MNVANAGQQTSTATGGNVCDGDFTNTAWPPVHFVIFKRRTRSSRLTPPTRADYELFVDELRRRQTPPHRTVSTRKERERNARSHPPQLPRRSGSLVATALLPDFAWATSPEQRPFFTSAENGRRKLLELNRPIIHVPGQNYIDTTRRVADLPARERLRDDLRERPRAVRNPQLHVPHDFEIVDPAWARTSTPIISRAPLRVSHLAGDGRRAHPGDARCGMELGAVQGAQLRRVSVKRCARGPNFSWPSRNVRASTCACGIPGPRRPACCQVGRLPR